MIGSQAGAVKVLVGDVGVEAGRAHEESDRGGIEGKIGWLDLARPNPEFRDIFAF